MHVDAYEAWAVEGAHRVRALCYLESWSPHMSEILPPPLDAPLPGQEPFETNKTLGIIAIVVGVISCGCITLILGILGLVNANKAQSLWSVGDVQGAQRAASTARTFSIIAFVFAAIWFVFVIIGWTTGSFTFTTN